MKYSKLTLCNIQVTFLNWQQTQVAFVAAQWLKILQWQQEQRQQLQQSLHFLMALLSASGNPAVKDKNGELTNNSIICMPDMSLYKV